MIRTFLFSLLLWGSLADADELMDERIYAALDKYGDIVVVEREDATKTLKTIEIIQGKAWFHEADKNTEVPFDQVAVEGKENERYVLFRKRENPSRIYFRGKPMPRGELDLARLRVLAKQPVIPEADRPVRFLAQWSDVAYIECDQQKGIILEARPLKGAYFDSLRNVKEHKIILLNEAYKHAPESYARCIIYGNPTVADARVRVVWVNREGRLPLAARMSFRLEMLFEAARNVGQVK